MTDLNPYQTPDAEVSSDRQLGSGDRVYKAGHIGVATFLGTPLAGFWLMAANYAALGYPEKRGATVGIGLAVTIPAIALTYWLPQDGLVMLLNIAMVIGMIWLCSALQGDSLTAYVEDETYWYSGWRAAGIGILVLMAEIALMVSVLLIGEFLGYDWWVE